MKSKIILALFIAGFLVLPTVDLKAQTTESQIQQLLEKIQSLKTQIQQIKTQQSSSAAKTSFSRTLQRGSTGEDVRKLQSFLRERGHFNYRENTTYFGSITEEAVKKFQTKNNISPVGIAGPKTRSKISKILDSYPNSGIINPDPYPTLIKDLTLDVSENNNQATLSWKLTEVGRATFHVTCTPKAGLYNVDEDMSVKCQKEKNILSQDSGIAGQTTFTTTEDNDSTHAIVTLIAANENGVDKSGWGVDFPIPIDESSNGPEEYDGCVITGCSSQLCVDSTNSSDGEVAVDTNCAYLEKYACYETAICERNLDGECGWRQTEELQSCLEETETE